MHPYFTDDMRDALTDRLIAAFEDSGTSSIDVSEGRREPRKFQVKVFLDEVIEVWVYAWHLREDWESKSKLLRLVLPPRMPAYRTCERIRVKGATLIMGYESGLGVFVGFGLSRNLGFSSNLDRLRIPMEFLFKGFQEGMAIGEWRNEWNAREVMAVVRPDLLLDYVRSVDEIHRVFRSDEAFAYMNAFSLFASPLVDTAPVSVPADQRVAVETVVKRIRDKNFRKKVMTAYEHRCAVSRMRLKLVDAAHIYPARFGDSGDEVGNGILLSPTFHRAFDRGLIFLDEDYVMRVNERRVSRLAAEGLDDGVEAFRRGLEMTVHLPADRGQWPNVERIKAALVARKIFRKA